MTDEYEAILRSEFDAEEGSFLLRLRCELEWDRVAFSRLVHAMHRCCLATQGTDHLPRWQADGFWYVSWFVRSWSAHPNFPPVEPAEYYAQALELLDDLAFWYFQGECPRQNPESFKLL